MKILYVLLLTFSTVFSYSQVNNPIASCCSGSGGKCTGSAYCTACTNCGYCGHCNSGGSCGVCSSSKTKSSYKPYKKKTYSSKTYSNNGNYYLSDDISSKYYLKTLEVNSETLNLRKGPSTKYSVITTLKKYQELVFLAMTGDWVKVRVKSNGATGFVHYKYVLVSD